jgi:putative ABC transport system ATP-binding protein
VGAFWAAGGPQDPWPKKPPPPRLDRHLEQVALGLAGDLGATAGGGLDRGEDRAGAGQLAARVGHRRVATGGDEGGTGVERPLRRQQLVVVEAAVAGDDDRVRLPGAFEQGRPCRRDHLLQRRRPDHQRAAATRRLARQPRRDHSGGDHPGLLDLDPQLAQSLRVGGRRFPRVVGDEDDPFVTLEQRPQRLGRARDGLAADPDDPVVVNQKSVEAVGEGHGRTLVAQLIHDSIACPAVSANGPVVVATDLHRRYGEGDTAVDALAGVTTAFERDRFTAIMGPSGSGKSTLMHILAGLDKPTAGTVELDGVDITRLDDGELTQLRRDKLGFVFQFFNLLPVLTAEENLVLPLSIAGRKPDQAWVDQLIATVGLQDRRTHRPAELSGGQQQRVAVARALVSKPSVVFADEPTGNLDSKASADVMKLLRGAVDDFDQTVVMVTHDPVAAAHADRLITLQDGRIVSDAAPGSADDVIELQKQLD